MTTNRMLLIADSGNGVIRQFDTLHNTMTTWFTPLDRVAPEMVTPVAVAVTVDSNSNTLVFVLDVGFSSPKLSSIGIDGAGKRILTALSTADVTGLGAPFFPAPQLTQSTAGLTAASMLYITPSGHLASMLDTGLSASSVVSPRFAARNSSSIASLNTLLCVTSDPPLLASWACPLGS